MFIIIIIIIINNLSYNAIVSIITQQLLYKRHIAMSLCLCVCISLASLSIVALLTTGLRVIG
jgi:hypothetical protein